MSKKYVVYTALFGNYDFLTDVSHLSSSDIEYVCFTDIECSNNLGWKIVKVDSFKSTPAMMNRYYKLHPHLFFSNYEASLYVDANIKLKSNLNVFFERYITKGDFLIPRHAQRDCIFKEAKECIILKKGNEKTITQQMLKYKKDGMPLGYGLGENNILFRRHNNSEIKKIMADWWRELVEESQRDQLSLAYVMWKNNKKLDFLDETCRNDNNYFEYEIHKKYRNRSIFDKLKDRVFLTSRRIKYNRWCV
ncbi:DUF616 domain-containing protein [Escherichia albertii]|uniref:glycosyltransferase domain-containing protein n=1 Tax=Escherichia albertii TaxID=208962 RepID=UPI0014859495|nr:glycosyltransferase domain-containing protein [Escherichia albertii]MCU7272565.1 DUF616 domain-containing protein [Escherichia albertii]